ncbi:MAG TPA: GAF domain-containing protein, partial [Polyangiaceae bacterium]|nr:GAF domain-containing protein [Polyangiaceae bacterium]
VEALLWASFRDVSRELADRPGQKFVQLAVFDHKFDKRPERAPLGTLAWKDWRGNPVLTFPLFDGTSTARASVPAPSIKPVAVVRVSSSLPPIDAAPPAPPVAAAAPMPAPSAEPDPGPLKVALTPVSLLKPVEAKSDPQAAIPLTREKIPSSPPGGARASRPRLAAVRRRAGEDLIGELFETMHDLHFMHGVADGAEFLLAAVDSVVPCDGVLIHVFDINTQNFVVVRAKGPGTMQVLMHRTPDSDPFLQAVMRRPGSVAFHDVEKDPRVLGPRWDALGIKPTRVLCGPVRQGGRYLGLLEIANPIGDAPFHQTEQNALDYVCEQFAEFLVNRPIVLDADVILRR